MSNFKTHMGVWVGDSTKMGWLTSILELGAWFGTLYSGFLAEILSRKYAILINVAVFIIGVVIQTTAVTSSGHSSILGGRFITGESFLLFIRGPNTDEIQRYGRGVAVHDRANVQRRDRASRSSRRPCRFAATLHRYGNYD
jgi:Sugar (and other) transporter